MQVYATMPPQGFLHPEWPQAALVMKILRGNQLHLTLGQFLWHSIQLRLEPAQLRLAKGENLLL